MKIGQTSRLLRRCSGSVKPKPMGRLHPLRNLISWFLQEYDRPVSQCS